MNHSDEFAKLSPPLLWDRFAQHFLDMNEDVAFGVAETATELETVFRQRYSVVTENGWAQPSDYPDGLERDEYDARAIQIIGRNVQGDIIASGRVVLPVPNKQLPTEDFFHLIIEPKHQVVDVGRGIVTESDQRHVLFLGLMSQAWVEIRQRGFHEICGAMTPSMLRLYRMMDIPWIILGDKKSYWGEKRIPCKFDLTQTAKTYLAKHRAILFPD